MRIDVMKDAVIMAIEELRKRSVMSNQYRFGIYGFASDTRVFLDVSDPRSGDYDAVIAAVRPALCITHAPGHMLVTDLRNSRLAIL